MTTDERKARNRERRRAWRAANPDKARAQRAARRDKEQAYDRARYAADPSRRAEVNDRTRQWQASQPEYMKRYHTQRVFGALTDQLMANNAVAQDVSAAPPCGHLLCKLVTDGKCKQASR